MGMGMDGMRDVGGEEAWREGFKRMRGGKRYV